MKYEITITGLWLIAILATLLLTRESHLFTQLGPVFLICMIGSILTVRAARKNG